MRAAILPASRRRVVVRTLETAIVAILAAYTVHAGVANLGGSDSYSALWEAWLQNGLLALAAVLCFLRPVFVRAERRSWLALSGALALWTVGNTYWSFALHGLDPTPFPSLADAGYLAFYPFAYISLVLLVRSGYAKAKAIRASTWLDGLTAGLGAAALGAALAFGPILRSTGGSRMAVATTLAYPLADLLLLAIVVGVMALRAWRPGQAWAMLGIGLVLFALADSVYMFRAATNTYQEGTLLDALWPAGIVVMALAAWRTPTKEPAVRAQARSELFVPVGFVAAAIGLLVYDHYHRIPTLAMLLATGTVLMAVARTVLTFREVRSLADSRRQARTDELTNLGNRRMFYERLTKALATRGEHGSLALLLIDLDRFKEINDSLGHQVGDDLLRQIGPRLDSAMRPGDVLARLGGDEFALLVGPAGGAEFAVEIANRIRAAIAQPFRLDGVALHIDASVGIALCPDHGTEANALMQRADVAMYQAKAMHSGCEVYQPHRDHHSRDRLETIADLRTALTSGELVVHYQPKAELRTGRIIGVEALVRWQHPTRGLLYPDAFIALAEQTGLMRPLTMQVLEMALRQIALWRADGIDLTVAVNLSVTNLLDTDLPGQVERLLERLGLTGSVLDVEITESDLMVDTTRSQEVVERLRTLGVGVAVDDYGTGYSSLAYLRQLALDELKLDRCFIADIDSDPAAAAIVRSTVDLAHSLGLRMVAEGVESARAWAQLQEFGCDVAQGYYLSRPQPAADLTPMLHDGLVPRAG